MTVKRWFQQWAAWAACVGMLSPAAVFGAPVETDQVRTVSAVRDVALQDGSILRGQLVDATGQALGQVGVTIKNAGQTVAEGQTDAQGYFSVTGLRGGIYEVQASRATAIYRVWHAQAAPPSAVNSILLVDPSAQVVRGQYMDPYAGGSCGPMTGAPCGPGPVACGPAPCGPAPCGPVGGGGCGGFGWLCNPWVIGGAIAAAIAIPLALSDDDDDDAS